MQTLFHITVAKGYENLIDLLAENGADPNAKDAEGYPPLWIAVNGNGYKHKSITYF